MNAHRMSGHFVIGLVVIGVGVLLLLGSTGVLDIGDVFLWIPSLFILLGVWLMIKSRFRRIGGPILMILIAGIIQLMILGLDVGRFWPVILIIIGTVVLVNSFRSRGRSSEDGATRNTVDGWIESVSVFGSTRESVVSSEFKGGQATTVMGEARLDLRETSVMEKPAALEITVVMGEMKLRVPRDWNVRLDNVTVMGESKDERLRREADGAQTDLVISGAVVMGSLKIED